MIRLKGVRLEEKERPSPRRITVLTVPGEMLLPLTSGTLEGELLVEKGSRVVRFQPVLVSGERPPVYSPVCGTVTGFPSLQHPVLGEIRCASIAVAQRQKALRGIPPAEKGEPDAALVLQVAGSASIVDEWDGTPLYDKIKRMRETGIKCLLGAAFDDDPYLSSSEAAFSCDAEAALDGLRLAARAAGAETVRLVCTGETGRRKLKEQSAELLLEPGPKYPAWALLRQDPAFCAAEPVGIQACIALSHAVREGLPQTDTVISVCGDLVESPKNVKVLIGTPAREVLSACGLTGRARESVVIMGSLFRGKPLRDFSAPITAETRGLLVISSQKETEYPCIGCGTCERVCPAALSTWRLAAALRRKRPNRQGLLQWGQACLSCYACAVQCPSGLSFPKLFSRIEPAEEVRAE